jgi:hypothetical protein
MQRDAKKGYIRVNCQLQNSQQVAAAVACSVTVPASQYHWVARNGRESLFAFLEVVLPQVDFVVETFESKPSDFMHQSTSNKVDQSTSNKD